MKQLFVFFFSSFILLSSAVAAEIWLTPERKAGLERIAARPRVISQERMPDGATVSRWTNGNSEWSVTNRPAKSVLGKKSVNGWQKKLADKEAEKQAILADLETIKSKPTKKAIEDVISKHKAADLSKAPTR